MSRSSFVLEHVHSIQQYGGIHGSVQGQARELTEIVDGAKTRALKRKGHDHDEDSQ